MKALQILAHGMEKINLIGLQNFCKRVDIAHSGFAPVCKALVSHLLPIGVNARIVLVIAALLLLSGRLRQKNQYDEQGYLYCSAVN